MVVGFDVDDYFNIVVCFEIVGYFDIDGCFDIGFGDCYLVFGSFHGCLSFDSFLCFVIVVVDLLLVMLCALSNHLTVELVWSV